MRTVIAWGLGFVLLACGAGCGNNEPLITKPAEGNRGAARPGGKIFRPGGDNTPPVGNPANQKPN